MSSWMKLKSEPPLKWNEPYPLFNRVSLETIGRCTRECTCCPSRFRTKKQQGTMSHEVYGTIMTQLSDLEFSGVLQLFYLGEPLLDKDIVHRVKLAREACPKAKLLIVSNGDLLKHVEQIDELFEAGLNVFNIDCYEEKIYEQALELANDCDPGIDVEYDKVRWKSSGVKSKTLVIIDVTQPEIARRGACHTYLHSEIEERLRKNGMLALKKQKYCAQPHRRLVIWWNGQIALCCVVTPLIKNPPIVGTAYNLLAAWNNVMMSQYRWWLQQGRKEGVCVDCYYKHAFPHIVRRITKPPLRR